MVTLDNVKDLEYDKFYPKELYHEFTNKDRDQIDWI